MNPYFVFLFAPLILGMDIVVPSYFYPANAGFTYWTQMAYAAPDVPITAILNPNSTAVDSNYALASITLRSSGGKVIGYVHSSYGNRPISEIKSDIAKFLSFYTIDGFFIDEMSNLDNTTIIQFYKDIYDYIKGKNNSYIVVENPGSIIPESYLLQNIADRYVVLESSQTAYASYSQPAYFNNYPANTFIHMVYSANVTQMAANVAFAKGLNIGGVYITDDGLPNPYDTLPSYFDSEVREVAAANDNETTSTPSSSCQ